MGHFHVKNISAERRGSARAVSSSQRLAPWRALLLVLSFALLGLSLPGLGCSTTEEAPPDRRRELLRVWGEHVIMPMYRDVEQSAGALSTASQALCRAPSQEQLARAQSAWTATRAHLKQTELIGFGPAVEEPLRYWPKLDFWPARVATIEAVLTGSMPLSAETVANMGSAERGLPVLEYLLFQPEIDLVEAFTQAPRRCEYLVAAAADAASSARGLREAWDPAHGDYLSRFTEPSKDNPAFRTVDAALGEVVNRMAFISENAQSDKLSSPLGKKAGGVPQPQLVESRFVERSAEDIADTLRGVERFYFVSPEGGMGLVSLSRHQEALTSGMRQHLGACYAALDSVHPLGVAVEQDPAGVQQAIDALDDLQTFVQVDVMGDLGIRLTFNDNDGD